MAERIGEFLGRIGLMKETQVEEVLSAQRNGDQRTFGEIAISLGFIDGAAIQEYLESKK
ncbi:hypothetical protein ES703_119605 [subsurface metagenome]